MKRTLATLAVLAAGAVAVPAHAATAHAPAPAQGVVALIDTGINPYNVVFRDRSALAQRYPGTYLPGYPAHVPALRLTLDARSFDDALRADCSRVWSHVKVGQLYWIPGTKIVGAISFQPTLGGMCPGASDSTILDSAGHGTMTASRAVATGYGACPACRLVEIQGVDANWGIETMDGAAQVAEAGVRFAGDNASWIDAQSNSWSPALPYDPSAQTGILSGNPEMARVIETAAQRQLTFFASGNGAANLDAPPPRTTLGYAHETPSVLVVGGEDSGHVLDWPNIPVHLAADACNDWGASYTSTTASDSTTGGGTSAATPYVAAGAVRELIEARRLLGDRRTGVHGDVVASGHALANGPLADGRLTLAEWRRVVLTTATTRPVAEPTDGPTCSTTVGPQWSSVPAGAPEFLAIGYGVVDSPARALAARVLAGTVAMPDRSTTDHFFTAYDDGDSLMYQGFTSLP